MNRGALSIGIAVLLIGTLLILDQMLYIDFEQFLIPTIILILGILILLNPSFLRNFGSSPKSTASNETTPSSAIIGTQKFKTLYGYAKAVEILGWIIMVAGLGYGYLAFKSGGQTQLIGIASAIAGIVIGLALVLTGQSILVIIQIENNTRQNVHLSQNIKDLLSKESNQ